MVPWPAIYMREIASESCVVLEGGGGNTNLHPGASSLPDFEEEDEEIFLLHFITH